jgi:hypothetical protein
MSYEYSKTSINHFDPLPHFLIKNQDSAAKIKSAAKESPPILRQNTTMILWVVGQKA